MICIRFENEEAQKPIEQSPHKKGKQKENKKQQFKPIKL
jgi:hypothetical protein